MAKACAMRMVTASVGFGCSRSISLSMERLTPPALASCFNDQPCAARSCFTRPPKCRLMASGGMFAAANLFEGFFVAGMIFRYTARCSCLSEQVFLLYRTAFRHIEQCQGSAPVDFC